jgi:hypothetical protein
MIRRPRSRPRRPRDVPATGGSQAPLPSLSTSGFCKTRGTDSGRNGSGPQRGFSLDDDARRSLASRMRLSAMLAPSPRGPPEPKHPVVGDPLGRADRDSFNRSVHPPQHRSVHARSGSAASPAHARAVLRGYPGVFMKPSPQSEHGCGVSHHARDETTNGRDAKPPACLRDSPEHCVLWRIPRFTETPDHSDRFGITRFRRSASYCDSGYRVGGARFGHSR